MQQYLIQFLIISDGSLFETLPDAELFASLPGAGPYLAPRLLVAFSNERDRFSSAQAFMSYVGIAPVKEESGKKRWVHWRWSCPIFLRQTFVEWVNQARRFSLDRKHSIFSKSGQANLIKKRFGHWLTSGAEFSGGVGKAVQLTTKRNI